MNLVAPNVTGLSLLNLIAFLTFGSGCAHNWSPPSFAQEPSLSKTQRQVVEATIRTILSDAPIVTEESKRPTELQKALDRGIAFLRERFSQYRDSNDGYRVVVATPRDGSRRKRYVQTVYLENSLSEVRRGRGRRRDSPVFTTSSRPGAEHSVFLRESRYLIWVFKWRKEGDSVASFSLKSISAMHLDYGARPPLPTFDEATNHSLF